MGNIYTITLTNKETGQELSRDYDFENGDTSEEYGIIINSMKKTLEDNKEKF